MILFVLAGVAQTIGVSTIWLLRRQCCQTLICSLRQYVIILQWIYPHNIATGG